MYATSLCAALSMCNVRSSSFVAFSCRYHTFQPYIYDTHHLNLVPILSTAVKFIYNLLAIALSDMSQTGSEAQRNCVCDDVTTSTKSIALISNISETQDTDTQSAWWLLNRWPNYTSASEQKPQLNECEAWEKSSRMRLEPKEDGWQFWILFSSTTKLIAAKSSRGYAGYQVEEIQR